MPAEKRQALEKQYQSGAARIDSALSGGKGAAALPATDATPDQGNNTWHPLVNKQTGETRYYNPSNKEWRDTPPEAAPTKAEGMVAWFRSGHSARRVPRRVEPGRAGSPCCYSRSFTPF